MEEIDVGNGVTRGDDKKHRKVFSKPSRYSTEEHQEFTGASSKFLPADFILCCV